MCGFIWEQRRKNLREEVIIVRTYGMIKKISIFSKKIT